MDFLTLTLELFRNADHFIMYIAQTYGWWVYLVLFMIFYSETGIVICAFLPGDSLLFIAGAAAAAGALTQLRAYATVYQEIVQAVMTNSQLPEVLASVLQPHVEYYKKNLKGGVVVPGRIS